MKLGILVTVGCVLVLTGCMAGERPQQPRPRAVRTPRDIYASTRSDPVALRAWEDASRRALRSGLSIAPSFRERVLFPPDQPLAVAYRFTLVRGQALGIRVQPVNHVGPVFVDAFLDFGGDVFRPIQSAGQAGGAFTLVARTDGEYVLRIQPTIGRGGMYEVSIGGDPSLMFPVAGADLSALGGRFGDVRENGAREHEGIDIMAPRGTPVLAVADGYIQQSRNTPTGGLVIWQRDAARPLTYYYAHLDELLIGEGARVSAGDVIGVVGNTGNARGTPPHLHFGIYRPGTIAVDPVPLLVPTERYAAAPIDGRSLGSLTRVNGDHVRLHRSPSDAGTVIAELSPATPLLVLGDSGDWQRVVLPDGTTGFVAARFTESGFAGTRMP